MYCYYNYGMTITTMLSALKKLRQQLKRKLNVDHFDSYPSYASMLISEGMDIKKVQEWLGHSSISTTGNIYAHILLETKIDMGNTLEKALNISN